MLYRLLFFLLPLGYLFSPPSTYFAKRFEKEQKDTLVTISPIEKIKKGKLLFEQNCLLCHGALGKGDGYAGIYLNPRPFDISSEKLQIQSDSTLFFKITLGKAPMPTFKALPFESRLYLLMYVRELGKNNNKQTAKNDSKK